jgi:hypothetical protein
MEEFRKPSNNQVVFRYYLPRRDAVLSGKKVHSYSGEPNWGQTDRTFLVFLSPSTEYESSKVKVKGKVVPVLN